MSDINSILLLVQLNAGYKYTQLIFMNKSAPNSYNRTYTPCIYLLF